MNRSPTPYLLATPAGVLLVGLLIGPLVLLLRVSLYEPSGGRGFFVPHTWTLTNYATVTDAYGLRLLGFTVAFAVTVATLSVALGYPLALFVRAMRSPWQQLALAGVLLPKLASLFVLLFGLQQLLGEAGPLQQFLLATGVIATPLRLVRSWWGAVVAEVVLILPYVVLVLGVQLGRIEPTWEAAARGLGASSLQVFARLTLPLSLPGLALAGQLALMWGMGALLGPLLLGGPEQTTLSVEIHRQAFEYGRWPRAAALAVLLAGSVGLVVFTFRSLFGLLLGKH